LCFFPFGALRPGRMAVRFDCKGTTIGHGRTACTGNPSPLVKLIDAGLPEISKLQSLSKESANRIVCCAIRMISSRGFLEEA